MLPGFVVSLVLTATPWDDALLQHKANLSQMQSFHGKVAITGTDFQTEYEIWSNGDKNRVLERHDYSQAPGQSLFRCGSMNGFSGRTLTGWDPVGPKPVPLDPGKNDADFQSVRGIIGPVRKSGSHPHFWYVLGLDLLPGWPLPTIAESSIILPNDDGKDASFRIETSAIPQLAGVEFELSPENGYLLRRIQSPDGTTSEILSFTEINGLHIPERVRRRSGDIETTALLIAGEVNPTISLDLLELQFPEGVRVDEPEKGLIHIWGQSEPTFTFTSEQEFNDFVVNAVRTRPAQGPGNTPGLGRGMGVLFWLNVGLLAVILMLFIARRKLAHGK